MLSMKAKYALRALTTLARHAPDVIGLQEVHAPPPGSATLINGLPAVFGQAHELAAALGGYHAYVVPGRRALSGASEMRIFLAVDPEFPGPNVAALLGVDEIRAVPEPGVAILVGAGLAALAARRR